LGEKRAEVGGLRPLVGGPEGELGHAGAEFAGEKEGELMMGQYQENGGIVLH
jgi:hypothetical protein